MILGFLTCKEALARLDDYLDRELAPRELSQVATHLKICRHCAEVFAFEADFVADVREKVGRVQVPHGLLEQILADLPPSLEEPVAK